MGLIVIAAFLGFALLSSVIGGLSLLVYGLVTRDRRRRWARCALLALLLSGSFALFAQMSFQAAQGSAVTSMPDSFEKVFRGIEALGICGGFGLTALVAALLALAQRGFRRDRSIDAAAGADQS